MSALDRAIALQSAEVKELARPVAVVQEAAKSGDPSQVWEYGRALKRVGQVAGINLAQLLFHLDKDWEDRPNGDQPEPGLATRWGIDDDLINVVQEQLGVTGGTFNKYTRAWRRLYGAGEGEGAVPAGLRLEVMSKPWEHQLLLSAASVEMTPAQWRKATKANSREGVREIVKEVRGARTSSSKAIKSWIKPDGTWYARQGQGKPVIIGILRNSKHDLEDPVRSAMFARIVNGLGVQETK